MFIRNLIALIFLFSPLVSQDLQFNSDSAYQTIEHLSVTIGPRIMGSEQEKEALYWAKGKYESFDADTAYILPFTIAERGNDKLITNSGTAVGVFKGKNDSIIVIGGHLDSAGPEYPGANDNASGTATVIELARLWSQRSHYYTMVFCSFGGEEVGLIGSKNFVKDFSKINKVILMVSADMGGTDSKIGVMFETDSIQAPKWLVKDAFNVNSEINFNRLFYDTHFSTQNYLSSRGSGSDHMPFLNKGIPAIDFTADVNDSPIHTQQDKIDFINKIALGKYGNFIDHFLLQYQNGGIKPSKLSDESFILWQLAGFNIYIPIWLITILNVIAILLGIGTFLIARKNRMIIEKSQRIHISGLKAFIIFIIILIFSQLGEAFIQLFKGYRYPWMVHINTYLFYAVIWTLGGLWVGLQLTRKWKFSPDPYIYSKRTLIVLFIFTVGSLFLSSRLAFYPGFMLMLVSFGMLIKKDWLSILLILISPILIFLFVFNEEFTFMTRMLINTGFQFDNILKSFISNAVLIALLSLLFLPMLNAYAYLAAKYESIKRFLKFYRKPVVAYGLLLIIIGFGIYTGLLPAYNDMWRPSIQVDATYKMSDSTSELTILGNEYFKDLKVSGDTLMEFIDTRIHKIEVPSEFIADWIRISGSEAVHQTLKDTVMVDSIAYKWILHSNKPFLRYSFTIKTDTAEIIDPESILPFNHEKNRLQFEWYGFTGDSLNVEGSFKAEPGAKIIRKLEARYVGIPVDLKVESKLASVRYRTTVEYTDTLSLDMDKIVQINKFN
jgi:hypothetical protein